MKTITIRALAALLVIVLATAQAARAGAAERVALLIGNEAYRNISPLSNPVRDVRALAVALERVGFEVTLALNTDYEAFDRALRRFGDVADAADIALVFYAGHGVEDEGLNYLLPVDASIERQDVDSYKRLLSAGSKQVADLERLVSFAQRGGIVIIDACRDNPLANELPPSATRGSVRGLVLAQPEASGVLTAYAAGSGMVAFDGRPGKNSPYTAAIIETLGAPPKDVRIFFGAVRDRVMAATGGEQAPELKATLGGESIYLSPPPDPVAAQRRISWNILRDTDDVGALERFAATFPGTPEARAALARVRALRPPTPSPEQIDPGALESFLDRMSAARNRNTPSAPALAPVPAPVPMSEAEISPLERWKQRMRKANQ